MIDVEKRDMTLRELFDTGSFEGIEYRFDKQEEMRRDYENRCQAQCYEQINKIKSQLDEKEATIQSLLKCLRLLN